MNILNEISALGINTKYLDDKKQQTSYKIKYIKEYIDGWAYVSCNRDNIKEINFIDCMCNAGVYRDGDLCTSMEILKIFIDFSSKYPDKTFNLFLNDYDGNRINILNKVKSLLLPTPINNINIYITQKDVNDYLSELPLRYNFNNYCATILFVDPYDFGTVHIDVVKNFIEKHYCELLFNFFISDYERNGIDDRIKKCIENCVNINEINNKEDLINFIFNQLKVGRMEYKFSYKFKNQKNRELYQIIFFTPHIRGLEVLKEALWKVFNGQFYHINIENNESQMSLFNYESDKNCLLAYHANVAKDILLKSFSSKIMKYNDIEIFLIENTMLSDGQIIKNVLKPLIDEGKIKKLNQVENKRDYKKDSYEIIGGLNASN